MVIPVKPTRKQAKAIRQKYKDINQAKGKAEQARIDKYKNDPKANAAVQHMTTEKGYDPNPLTRRSGTVPPPPLPPPAPKKGKSKPKFRSSGMAPTEDY